MHGEPCSVRAERLSAVPDTRAELERAVPTGNCDVVYGSTVDADSPQTVQRAWMMPRGHTACDAVARLRLVVCYELCAERDRSDAKCLCRLCLQRSRARVCSRTTACPLAARNCVAACHWRETSGTRCCRLTSYRCSSATHEALFHSRTLLRACSVPFASAQACSCACRCRRSSYCKSAGCARIRMRV